MAVQIHILFCTMYEIMDRETSVYHEGTSNYFVARKGRMILESGTLGSFCLLFEERVIYLAEA